MPEFLHLLSSSEALDRFLNAIPASTRTAPELIPAVEALNRILYEPVTAPHPLPPFARSTHDGYAVRAADTYGASPSLPAYLKLIGEIEMGVPAELVVGPSQCALIHTGGMIPNGADAVVMIEDTQVVREGEIEVLKPVAVGQHVLIEGEDVKTGEIVLEAGSLIRAQEIGGILALGVTDVNVARRPRVGILSTGDEIVAPDEEVQAGQIRDINTHTLSALVSRAGGEPIARGIIPDRYDVLFEAAEQAHAEDDIVIITAGSSVSARDITVDVLGAFGEPGVLVHGIAIKPGKPTILAVADGVPMIGLPGNPVSALVVAGLFVVPLIRMLMGMERPALVPTVSAQMSINVASETGREDYLPVRLHITEDGLVAEPIFGRSNLIFTLVRADGLVRISPEATGLSAGTDVKVRLF
jgi:molybdopterin molybdotransferase